MYTTTGTRNQIAVSINIPKSIYLETAELSKKIGKPVNDIFSTAIDEYVRKDKHMFNYFTGIVPSFDSEYKIVDIGQLRVYSDDYSGIGEPLSNRDASINWIKNRIKVLKNERNKAKKMNNIIGVKSLENEIWKLKREAAKRFFMVFSDSELSTMEKLKLKRLASKCKRLYIKNKKTLSQDDIDGIIKLKKFLKNKLIENKCIPADYPEDLLIIQRKKIIPGYIPEYMEKRMMSITEEIEKQHKEFPLLDFSSGDLDKVMREFQTKSRFENIEDTTKKIFFTKEKKELKDY